MLSLAASCLAQGLWQQLIERPPIALSAPLKGKHRILLHFDQTQPLKVGDIILPGDRIGSVTPWPKTLSPTEDEALKEGIRYYEKGDYLIASDVFRSLYASENNNPFYLIYAAKTLYWVAGGSYLSLSLFERLNSIIEAPYIDLEDSVVIDLWFPDLYWKMANLYLERQEYDKVAYEIARTFAGGTRIKDPALEQMLEYLTEAYFFLVDTDLNHEVYDCTMKLFPSNEYVKEFYLQ
jgi:hypothetical protein